MGKIQASKLCVNHLIITLAARVFVPSGFGENIPTAEFGMVSAETACWDIKRKLAKFLISTFTCRSTFHYGGHKVNDDVKVYSSPVYIQVKNFLK